jgi:hypothetical protein
MKSGLAQSGGSGWKKKSLGSWFILRLKPKGFVAGFDAV